jgi:hypothetical protein
MNLSNIAIFGAPRSGTTWLGQLFNSSPNTLYRFQPLFSYEFKSKLTIASSKQDIQNFYLDLINAQSQFTLTNLLFPKTIPTHLVWKEVRYHHITPNLLQNSNTKIIYIERNPINVINSWYNASSEFNPKWDIQKEWLDAPLKNLNKPEEFNGFNKWLEVQTIHTINSHNHPDKVIKVKYEDLKLNPVKELKKLYKFCNLKWDIQVEDFIIDSTTKHEEDPYSVFKNQKQNLTLPKNIISLINQYSQ